MDSAICRSPSSRCSRFGLGLILTISFAFFGGVVPLLPRLHTCHIARSSYRLCSAAPERCLQSGCVAVHLFPNSMFDMLFFFFLFLLSGLLLLLGAHAYRIGDDGSTVHLHVPSLQATMLTGTRGTAGRRPGAPSWQSSVPVSALPVGVDWRPTAVSAVGSQGSCGGCYAFAAAGAMEGAWAIHSPGTYILMWLSDFLHLHCRCLGTFSSPTRDTDKCASCSVIIILS